MEKKFKIELELTKQEIEMILLFGYGSVTKENIETKLKSFDELNKNGKYIEFDSEFECDFRSILRIGFMTFAKLKNIKLDYPIVKYQKRKFIIKNLDAKFVNIENL
jgi:hypothetical protein